VDTLLYKSLLRAPDICKDASVSLKRRESIKKDQTRSIVNLEDLKEALRYLMIEKNLQDKNNNQLMGSVKYCSQCLKLAGSMMKTVLINH
jgi:hypothetical protein